MAPLLRQARRDLHRGAPFRRISRGALGSRELRGRRFVGDGRRDVRRRGRRHLRTRPQDPAGGVLEQTMSYSAADVFQMARKKIRKLGGVKKFEPQAAYKAM